MKKMWKITFGKNVDIVRVESETIDGAILKAKKYASSNLPLEVDGKACYGKEDREITEVVVLFYDWIK